MKVIALLLSLILMPALAISQGNDSGNSFSKAKKLLMNRVHYDHMITFYAGCKYNKDKKIDWNSCGFKPRKQAKRGSRLEWEHVQPAWAFGHHLQCWQKGGRKACRKNAEFRRMASDMHNLRPANGELNSDRSSRRFGIIPGEARAYGAVDFEVDFKNKIAEPAPAVRGDIARSYFYMSHAYGLRISKKQKQLFKAWNHADPVDEWERKRNVRIHRIQGNLNPFIK